MVELLKNWKGMLQISESEFDIYYNLNGFTLMDEKSSTYISGKTIIIINVIDGLKFLSELNILKNITEIYIDKCIDINEIIKYKDEFVSLKTISNSDVGLCGQIITQSDLKLLLINFPNIETLKFEIDYLITDFDFSLVSKLKNLNLKIRTEIEFVDLIGINDTYFQPLINSLPNTMESLYLTLPYFNCVLPVLPELKYFGVNTNYHIWRYGDDNIKLKNDLELFTKSLPPSLISLTISIPYFDGKIPDLPLLNKLVLSSKLFTNPLNLKSPLKYFELYCKNFNHSLYLPDSVESILLYRYRPDKTKILYAPSVVSATLDINNDLIINTIKNGGFTKLKKMYVSEKYDNIEERVIKLLPNCNVYEYYNIDDVCF